MWHDTDLTRLLGVRYPLVQAPMAGGVAGPALVAAASGSGALGSLGGGYLTPEQLRAAVREVQALTDRPFAVNLFVPAADEAARERVDVAAALLRPYRVELGLAVDAAPWRAPDFDAQLEVIFEERAPVFSFAFGVPSPPVLSRLRDARVVVIGTATTTREAVALEAAGVDVIVAQGSEAGGHRGTFLGDDRVAMIGTMALVPQVVDRVSKPVVAAGGIMDGRGLAAALALGAAGAQMGTAFLRCTESGASAAYRDALRASTDESTAVTRAFSGKPARGIRNRFMRELAPHEDALPPYPIQHGLTQDLRRAAAAQGRADLLALWAGQGAPLGKEVSAAALVASIVARAEAIVSAGSRCASR